MKKNMRSIYGIMLALVMTAGACNKPSQEEHAEEHHEENETVAELSPAQIKNAGVTIDRIKQRSLSGTIKVNGVLDVPPQQLVSVSVPLGGFLKSTSLLQGSRVKKGQLIAVIENPEYIQLQQDYLEAKSQYEFSKADYDRQQELSKENVNAQKTLQQSKTTYQTWQAKKNGLLARLKLINVNLAALEEGNITSTGNVYAPINGYVTEVNVNIGKFVQPADVLFEIVDTEHLHAELTVFEKDVPKIKLGQKVRFTLANETTERMATVYLIGREIDKDRTVRIHCHIDKEDTELLPGMYLKAFVETGGALVNAVPNEAVVDFQGQKFIFIPVAAKHEHSESDKHEGDEHDEGKHEERQHFSITPVTTGYSELGFTEVVLPEGIPADSEVVVTGAYAVLSKLKNSESEGHVH